MALGTLLRHVQPLQPDGREESDPGVDARHARQCLERSSRPERRLTGPPAPIELEIDGAVLGIGDGADTAIVAAVVRARKACT